MATATVAAPSHVAGLDQIVTLRGVRWETFEQLLADNPDRSAPRLTYDRGELELVSPSPEHEEDADALRLIVVLVTAALGIRIRRLGSTTYRRPDLALGFEPDGSFYIRHEQWMRERQRIDLLVDPPPDLVIEVDVSRSSIGKLRLLAEMSVPEVWRREGDRVVISILTDGAYREASHSAAIPALTATTLSRFLAESRRRSSPDWVALVIGWAQERRTSGP